MRRTRASFLLARHIYLVWRAGQLRFRLETFGLYYPTLPYRSPAWRFPLGNVLLMLRQSGAYAAWVIELEEIRRHGADGWWNRQ